MLLNSQMSFKCFPGFLHCSLMLSSNCPPYFSCFLQVSSIMILFSSNAILLFLIVFSCFLQVSSLISYVDPGFLPRSRIVLLCFLLSFPGHLLADDVSSGSSHVFSIILQVSSLLILLSSQVSHVFLPDFLC